MLILLLFSFLSGLVTIFAPCIWPLLPIILSSSTSGGHRKPLGITLGIMTSFMFFTLTLSYIVKIIPFDPDILRLFAVVVIGLLGLALVIPALSAKLEGWVSGLSGKFSSTNKSNGFWGGYATGFSLGIVWTPCAGPILATIATLSATRAVSFQVIFVTLSYVIGVGLPLFFFATLGQSLFTKSRFLSKYTGKIQQLFGVVMILTALAIFTNFDKTLQVRLLEIFPSYTNFINQLEGNTTVKKELDNLKNFKIEMPKIERTYSAPEFAGITNWLNTDKPVTIADLKGKVVLVDFWTYTCINCIRTLPHLTALYEKYKDKGFVIVGVHTPEFEFEKKTENVQNAIKQFNIHYPVAQDNDFGTWSAYHNTYWPAHYLIDAKGVVRETHVGEGDYEATEKSVQNLLNEAGQQVNNDLLQIEDQAPTSRLTPETYLGTSRMERYAGTQSVKGGEQTFTLSPSPVTHYFTFQGNWDIRPEYATTSSDSILTFHFISNKVFLVITPHSKDDVMKVYLDDKLVDEKNAGKDVKNGLVQFDMPRLYELIDLKGKTEDHILKLEFGTDGTELFAFTFG